MDWNTGQRFDTLFIQFQVNRTILIVINLAHGSSHIFLPPQMTFMQHDMSNRVIGRVNEEFIHPPYMPIGSFDSRTAANGKFIEWNMLVFKGNIRGRRNIKRLHHVRIASKPWHSRWNELNLVKDRHFRQFFAAAI